MPKINREEYEVLKGLDDKWKWIARGEDSDLFVYRMCPSKSKLGLFWTGKTVLDERLLDVGLFQFIQWEDEEPYSIQKLIHDYEYKTGTFDWATAFQSALHGENEFITDVNQSNANFVKVEEVEK